MNPIEKLRAALQERFPKIHVTIDPPPRPDASWWLDINLEGYTATVEWRPNGGFGILSSRSYYHGEGPDEVFQDVASVLERLTSLLSKRTHTVSR